MRLFYAINFSSEVKNQLIFVSKKLKDSSVRGNFSQPENIHLTLEFLGECDRAMTDSAKRVLDALEFILLL